LVSLIKEFGLFLIMSTPQLYPQMRPYLAILLIVVFVVVIMTDISTYNRGEVTYLMSGISIFTSSVGLAGSIAVLQDRRWASGALKIWIVFFFGYLAFSAAALGWNITEIGYLLLFLGLVTISGEMGLLPH
jgi:hypothetical protein